MFDEDYSEYVDSRIGYRSEEILLLIQGTSGKIHYRGNNYLSENLEGKFVLLNDVIHPAKVLDDRIEKKVRSVLVRD